MVSIHRSRRAVPHDSPSGRDRRRDGEPADLVIELDGIEPRSRCRTTLRGKLEQALCRHGRTRNRSLRPPLADRRVRLLEDRRVMNVPIIRRQPSGRARRRQRRDHQVSQVVVVAAISTQVRAHRVEPWRLAPIDQLTIRWRNAWLNDAPTRGARATAEADLRPARTPRPPSSMSKPPDTRRGPRRPLGARASLTVLDACRARGSRSERSVWKAYALLPLLPLQRRASRDSARRSRAHRASQADPCLLRRPAPAAASVAHARHRVGR